MRKLVDRGIDWVGAVPEDWQFKKGKYLFQQRSERGNTIELQLLSPTQKFGCIPQSLYEELTGANAVKLNEKTDLNLLKTIHRGDFCISLRSFQGGFEHSAYEGVVSPAYQVFYPIHDNVYRGYFKYMFKDGAFIDKMNSFTLSLRDGKNIAFADFGNTLLPLPSIEEQRAIADYLDRKTSEIDAAINEAQELIEKYKSYKQSIITEAVTKGLDPHVPMKESGFSWIGKIPSSWRCLRGKYVLKYLQKSTKDDDGVITCFRDGEVTLRSNRREEGFTISEKEIGYQGIDVGDLVVHGMDGFAGAIGISDSRGKASPVLIVLDSEENKRHIMYFLRNLAYCEVFLGLATGIRVRSCDLRWNKLAETVLVLPSREEQKRIVSFLDRKIDEIDKLISQKEILISRLQEYKKSIIFEYVTGKKEVPNG